MTQLQAGSLFASLLVVLACLAPATATEGKAQTGDDLSSTVMTAALRLLNGVAVSDCLLNNPQRLDCVTLESTPGDITRGIAVFGVSDAGQNGGFGAVLGRGADGVWRLWFTSQNPYQLLRLPGEMRVCADGEGVNLRARASTDSDAVDTLADGTIVSGEQFVLTDAVEPGHAGFGWYRISSPESGWIHSKYLEAASLTDNCALRNAQVSGS